ncbi:hypothetical protein NUACC21_58780 [Scytonema sp. NUACC21]
MAPNLFDVNFYRNANPDLAAVGITTDAQLTSHFFNNGLNEGRLFSPLVDLNFYRSSNSDLSRLSYSRAYDHLQNTGIAEGRKFSPFFDLAFYREANSDLIRAGLNNDQLFDHLQNYGLNEGRNFSPFFDLNFYRSNNPDLVTAGFTNQQLLEHYVLYGFQEGRTPRVDFAGNTLNDAATIDLSLGVGFAADNVGPSDADDYYRLVLDRPTNLTVTSGVSNQNISGTLFNSSSQPLPGGFSSGVFNISNLVNINGRVEEFNFTNRVLSNTDVQTYVFNFLEPGTYYLRFQPTAGNTNYAFVVNSVPV